MIIKICWAATNTTEIHFKTLNASCAAPLSFFVVKNSHTDNGFKDSDQFSNNTIKICKHKESCYLLVAAVVAQKRNTRQLWIWGSVSNSWKKVGFSINHSQDAVNRHSISKPSVPLEEKMWGRLEKWLSIADLVLCCKNWIQWARLRETPSMTLALEPLKMDFSGSKNMFPSQAIWVLVHI